MDPDKLKIDETKNKREEFIGLAQQAIDAGQEIILKHRTDIGGVAFDVVKPTSVNENFLCFTEIGFPDVQVPIDNVEDIQISI